MCKWVLVWYRRDTPLLQQFIKKKEKMGKSRKYFGYWVLGTGYWVLGTGYWVLGTGYWVLGTGYWVLGTGYWVLGTGYWVAQRRHLDSLQVTVKIRYVNVFNFQLLV